MEQGPPRGLQDIGGELEVAVAIEENDAIVIREKFANMKSRKRPFALLVKTKLQKSKLIRENV